MYQQTIQHKKVNASHKLQKDNLRKNITILKGFAKIMIVWLTGKMFNPFQIVIKRTTLPPLLALWLIMQVKKRKKIQP